MSLTSHNLSISQLAVEILRHCSDATGYIHGEERVTCTLGFWKRHNTTKIEMDDGGSSQLGENYLYTTQ